jgi:hypothetical protein
MGDKVTAFPPGLPKIRDRPARSSPSLTNEIVPDTLPKESLSKLKIRTMDENSALNRGLNRGLSRGIVYCPWSAVRFGKEFLNARLKR